MGTFSPLNWKLRRIAGSLRQQDVAARAGMSTTRYSAFERGEKIPSEVDRQMIEAVLPSLNEGMLGEVRHTNEQTERLLEST
jgi:transcriptional regulator with XRE-family HTH domain